MRCQLLKYGKIQPCNLTILRQILQSYILVETKLWHHIMLKPFCSTYKMFDIIFECYIYLYLLGDNLGKDYITGIFFNVIL